MSANMKAAVAAAKLLVAVRLQAVWRGLAGRRQASALKLAAAKLLVAVRLQACWRGLAGRRRAAALRLDRQVV